MSIVDNRSKSRKFCSVFGCRSRGGGMFKFPSDSKLQNEWRNVCKLIRTVSSTMYVCRRHFASSDLYQTTMGLTRVRRGAKPSLHLPTSSPVKLKAKQLCVVYGCETNRDETMDGTFHSFPRDAGRRTYWQLVCRLMRTTRNTRICNRHFRDSDFSLNGCSKILKRSARPRLQLPDCSNAITIDRTEDILNALLPTNCQESMCTIHSAYSSCETQLLTDQKLFKENYCEQMFSVNQHFQCSAAANNADDSLECEMPFSCIETKMSMAQTECSILLKLNVNSQLSSLIGVSLSLLESLSIISLDLLMDSNCSFLSMKMRISITLCKLKLNSSFTYLSSLFGVDSSECIKYFVQTLPLLAKVLKCSLYWTTKDEVRDNMSKYFVEYHDLRLVLDCIELSFSSECIDCTSHLHCFTQCKGMVKTLIGIAPCGLISFVSQTHSSQISYSQIFKSSELFSKNLIDPYNDAIIVNNALGIHDLCSEMAFRVLCPSSFNFNFDSNVTEANVTSNVSFDAFVRDVKERLSVFQILKMKLLPCLIPFANDIIIVVTGIVNLTSPRK